MGLVTPWLGGVHGVLSVPSHALGGQPGVFLVYPFFTPPTERGKTGGGGGGGGGQPGLVTPVPGTQNGVNKDNSLSVVIPVSYPQSFGELFCCSL